MEFAEEDVFFLWLRDVEPRESPCARGSIEDMVGLMYLKAYNLSSVKNLRICGQGSRMMGPN